MSKLAVTLVMFGELAPGSVHRRLATLPIPSSERGGIRAGARMEKRARLALADQSAGSSVTSAASCL